MKYCFQVEKYKYNSIFGTELLIKKAGKTTFYYIDFFYSKSQIAPELFFLI